MQLGGCAQPARSWASLNPDILQLVFLSLSSPATPGTVHVTQTCRSWRRAASGVRGQQAEVWHLSSSRCDSLCRWIRLNASTLTEIRFSIRDTSSRRIRRVIAALAAAATDAAAAGEPLPLQRLCCPAPLQQLAHLLPLLPSLQGCGPLDVAGGANRGAEDGANSSSSSSSSDGSSLDRHDICSSSAIHHLRYSSHREAARSSDSSSSCEGNSCSSRPERAAASTTDLESLRACSHLQQLHLNLAPTCSCQPEATSCSCWQQVLQALPLHLVQLTLHGPVQLDLHSLQPHTQLEQLELHLYDLQDYTPLLKLPRLQRLAVGLSSHDHVSRLVPVKHLVKELTGPVGGDLQIPAELTALTSLMLFGSHVVPPDSVCQQLEGLSIAVYWPQGVEAMGRLLQQHSLFPRLRHLELRTEQGAQYLITALHHLTQLTSLHLHLTAASSSGEEPRWSSRWAGALRELTRLKRLSVPAQLMEAEAPWLSQLQQLEQLTVEGNLVTAAQLWAGGAGQQDQQQQQQQQQQQTQDQQQERPLQAQRQQQAAGQCEHAPMSKLHLQQEAAACSGAGCWRGWSRRWGQSGATTSAGSPMDIELQQLPTRTSSPQQQQQQQQQQQHVSGASRALCSSAAAAGGQRRSSSSSSWGSRPGVGGEVGSTSTGSSATATGGPSTPGSVLRMLRVLRVEGGVVPGLLGQLQQVVPSAACVVMAAVMHPTSLTA